MTDIRFTIDGKEILAKPSQTVLQAALDNGIHIPHLCYHPALTPFAGCRLCIIEIKGGKAPIASCALPVKEGIEVTAQNDKLHSLRKTALDLILSDHPLNCLTCEKNGVCDLQKYAYEFGLEKTSYTGETTSYPNETGNPLIEMSYQTCIMCGRCVIACNETVVNEAIDFTRRGFATKITTPLDVPRKDSDCVFCGACVDVCPVGALTDSTARFKGRISECEKASVICPYCGCGCSILLDIKDNRIVRSRGNPHGPANHGWLCIKGHFGMDFVGHQDRLASCVVRQNKECSTLNAQPSTNPPIYPSSALDESLNQSRKRLQKPLIRRDGILCEATWEEAIDLVVEKFTRIKKEHGPEALAALASAKCSNEENYLMQKLCRVLFGTNNIDHCARLCHASTVAGLAKSFGSAAMTNSIDEVENAEVILVIGSNTTEAHPIIGYAIKRAVNKGAKLIVCDPRAIELTEFSELWLRHKCGTDVALINGLMNVIISEGLENKEFIRTRTEGFEAVKKVVDNYPPEKASEITGVPVEDIRKAAKAYAKAKNAMVIYSMGITQHTTGTDNTMSLANFVMLCGQIGKPSSGLNPLRGQNNVQGACDAGCLPNVYPGYQSVNNPDIKSKFEKAWNTRLSDKPGLTVTEIIDAASSGKIKGLYIMGENPMLSDPNISHVDDGLKALDFLVVQDIFLTETAQRATVVLPATSFAEKEGTYTNTERRVQLSPAALKPVGQSRPDWQILSEIATRLAKELNINSGFEYKSPAELTDELASVAPIYCGIKYRRLNPKGGYFTCESIQWPCPSEDHPGTGFLHKDKFTCGLGKFFPIDYKPPAEEPDNNYPFTLTTGRTLYHYHTGSMTRRSAGPVFLVSEPYVEINPGDAGKLGISDGEKISIASRRGSIKIKATITDCVPQGTVFIPFHFAEGPANILTNPAIDPVAKIPEYKVCAVNITV
ncbi:MAG: formate dehydrogenase subunit alpha [Planctomycetes bacterium]|nr:formate dehydrogenase subunit alpha [Planctomycetota bacterium]